MTSKRHWPTILFGLLLLIGWGGLAARASAQATGEFLCSAGSNDGNPCESDEDCPNGVCIIAQGVCNGGDDDGLICDCPGGTCLATPICSFDTTLGTCSGGTSDSECCDTAFNCAGSRPCQGTQKVCFGGDDQGFACLNDTHCPGGVCCSSGKYCDGGLYDSYTCVDDNDCPSGTCTGEAGNCVLPTATRTPSRPATTSTPTRTAQVTPTPTRTTATTPTTPSPTPLESPTPSATGSALATPTPTTSSQTPQLVSALGPTDTTLSVNNASTLPDSGIVLIDAEQIAYTGKFGNTLTGLTRGLNGTPPSQHATGAAVVFLSPNVPTATPTEPPARVHIIGAFAKGGGCVLQPDPSGAWPAVVGALGLVAWMRRRRRG